MRWHYIPFLFTVAIVGCDRHPGGSHAELASAFIDTIEKDEGYRLGVRPEIGPTLAAAQMELPDLLNGCFELLRRGSL